MDVLKPIQRRLCKSHTEQREVMLKRTSRYTKEVCKQNHRLERYRVQMTYLSKAGSAVTEELQEDERLQQCTD